MGRKAAVLERDPDTIAVDAVLDAATAAANAAVDAAAAVDRTSGPLDGVIDALQASTARQDTMDARLESLATQLAEQVSVNAALQSQVEEALQIKAGFNNLVGVVQERFQTHADSMQTLRSGYEAFEREASRAIEQKDAKIETLQADADAALNRVLEHLAYGLHDRLFAAATAIEAGNETAKAGLILALLDQLEAALAEHFDLHVVKPRPGDTYDRASMTAIEAVQARRLWNRNETVAHTIRCGFHIGTDDECRMLRRAEVAAYRR